jgi:hypothetical protein
MCSCDEMKKSKAALSAPPPTKSRTAQSVAQRRAEVLPDFLACAGAGRVLTFHRARRIRRAQFALDRAEQALAAPFSSTASLAIDRAVVSLEAALAAAEAEPGS